MTLVIGIKCSDGLVVGADGAATFGSMGQRTIRQAVKKLTIVGDRVIVGFSGPFGLGQHFTGEIETLWNSKGFSDKKPFQVMTTIREAIWRHAGVELQIAGATQQVIGPAAIASALTSTIVAMPVSKKPCLFQFDQQGAPEEATNDLPFAAIGSGQSIADPFLAFLRRIFWPNRIPNLAEGIFATLWTLDHAILTNPGGVAEPKQIVILERDGNDWRARELLSEEFQEHQEAISVAERSLANFREGFHPNAGSKEEPPILLPPKDKS